MSGIRADSFVDHLNICHLHARSEEVGREAFGPHAEFMVALMLTVEHTMKCSPLILEVPDSYAMAERRFKDSGISFSINASGADAEDVTASFGALVQPPGYHPIETAECESRPWNDENLRVLKCATAIEQVLYDAVVHALPPPPASLPPPLGRY